ncbi:MAG: type II toxin-antitoxin system VapC family toxin [Gemmatimonadales bacterium]|nr:type II toxin-antitoxin system VapC family toxin [Gemmatimonadales bacterium]MDQ3427143.1 type II toxin-antitoxin system VapC family toxin [Gemmatimonadota bacterium]
MSLLLDTHVLIWWDEGRRLAPQALRAIQEAQEVYVSAASAWEIAIKTALGRLRPERTVIDAVLESGFVELPVTFRHAARVASLPPHHRDPFDRLLAAQAEVEGFILVTRDPAFVPYGIKLLRA